MLSSEDYLVIKTLKKRGVYLKDIAAELGVHPKTVSRALQREGAPQRPEQKRSSKLDPYKAEVDRLLAEGVWNAVVILREIQQQGYDGGVTIVRDYIRPKRALRASKATVRFETAPGRPSSTACCIMPPRSTLKARASGSKRSGARVCWGVPNRWKKPMSHTKSLRR